MDGHGSGWSGQAPGPVPSPSPGPGPGPGSNGYPNHPDEYLHWQQQQQQQQQQLARHRHEQILQQQRQAAYQHAARAGNPSDVFMSPMQAYPWSPAHHGQQTPSQPPNQHHPASSHMYPQQQPQVYGDWQYAQQQQSHLLPQRNPYQQMTGAYDLIANGDVTLPNGYASHAPYPGMPFDQPMTGSGPDLHAQSPQPGFRTYQGPTVGPTTQARVSISPSVLNKQPTATKSNGQNLMPALAQAVQVNGKSVTNVAKQEPSVPAIIELDSPGQGSPSVISVEDDPNVDAVWTRGTVVADGRRRLVSRQQSAPERKLTSGASLQRVTAPRVPSRPSEPLAAIKYDIAHCLNVENTSQAPDKCATALLATMSQCDPIPPASDAGVKVVRTPEQALFDSVDVSDRQNTLLTAVIVGLRDDRLMSHHLSTHKMFRAKLRTWFVRAHKENNHKTLLHLIGVLDMLKLDAELLAEVKFGKVLLVIARRSEDADVKARLAKYTRKAEAAKLLEDKADKEPTAPAPSDPAPTMGSTLKGAPPLEEAAKKRKVTARPADVKPIPKKPAAAAPAAAPAKVNSAFFSKPAGPPASSTGQKLTLSDVLSRVNKKRAPDVSSTTPASKTPTTAAEKDPEASTSSKKRDFSSIVSDIQGTATSQSSTTKSSSLSTAGAAKRTKVKKTVRWRPGPELEQVKLFETVEPEHYDGEETFGNSKDLEGREGELLHASSRFKTGGLGDFFIEWDALQLVDVSAISEGASTRSNKRAGTLPVTSKEADLQEEREKETFLIVYNKESDIPWTPTEATVDAATVDNAEPPKQIPLADELLRDKTVQRLLGLPAYAPPPPQLATAPPANQPPPPDLHSTLAALQGFIKPADQQQASNPSVPATDIASILAQLQPNAANGAPGPPMLPFPMPIPPPSAGTDTGSSTSMQSQSNPPAMFPPFPMPPMPPFQGMPMDAQQQDMPGSSSDFIHPDRQQQNYHHHHHQQQQPQQQQQQYQHHQQQDFQSGDKYDDRPAVTDQTRDVRPWVNLRDGAKYRQICRFFVKSDCRKGDDCPYIHPSQI
ncbi:hypothetical protein PYCC9005_001531 [Savitreella phatthalungensis]